MVTIALPQTLRRRADRAAIPSGVGGLMAGIAAAAALGGGWTGIAALAGVSGAASTIVVTRHRMRVRAMIDQATALCRDLDNQERQNLIGALESAWGHEAIKPLREHVARAPGPPHS